MKKCLLYGNCQIGVVYEAFKNSNLIEKYELKYVPCFNEKNNIEKIKIEEFDLIITQDIYQYLPSKSTNSILEKKNKNCKVIIIPSLYLNFYYPNLIYLKIKFENIIDQLRQPCDYHDINLLNLYLYHKSKRNLILENYIKIILDENFYSNDFYFKNLNNSIKKLSARLLEYSERYQNFTPIFFIDIVDFLKNNYFKNLLWYSSVHPNYENVINFICFEILKIINENNIILPKKLKLNFYDRRLPLYQSISNVVSFDTKKYTYPKIYDTEFCFMKDFVDLYCDVYDKKENKKYLDNSYFST